MTNKGCIFPIMTYEIDRENEQKKYTVASIQGYRYISEGYGQNIFIIDDLYDVFLKEYRKEKKHNASVFAFDVMMEIIEKKV